MEQMRGVLPTRAASSRRPRPRRGSWRQYRPPSRVRAAPDVFSSAATPIADNRDP